MDTGWNGLRGRGEVQGRARGAPLEVTWPPAAGKVMKISPPAYDTADFYTGVDFYPWQVDIPHEEVIFASGSADIPAAERAKLDTSVGEIAEAVKNYGGCGDRCACTSSGHTDTVGTTDCQPRAVAAAGAAASPRTSASAA